MGLAGSSSSLHIHPLMRADWKCGSWKSRGARHYCSQCRSAKVLAVREAWCLRFESTFTNVLNHTNYAPPATNIGSQSSFGVLTAAQTAENAGNRIGQI